MKRNLNRSKNLLQPLCSRAVAKACFWMVLGFSSATLLAWLSFDNQGKVAQIGARVERSISKIDQTSELVGLLREEIDDADRLGGLREKVDQLLSFTEMRPHTRDVLKEVQDLISQAQKQRMSTIEQRELSYVASVLAFARGDYRQCVEKSHADAHFADAALRLQMHANALMGLKRFEEAAQHLDKIVANQPTKLAALEMLANCRRQLGQLDLAKSCYDLLVQHYRESGDGEGLARALIDRAVLRERLLDNEQAGRDGLEAVRILEARLLLANAPLHEASLLRWLGKAISRKKDSASFIRAAEYYEQAIEKIDGFEGQLTHCQDVWRMRLRAELSRVYLSLRKYDLASRHVGGAVSICRRLAQEQPAAHTAELGKLIMLEGRVMSESGRAEQAVEQYGAAISCYSELLRSLPGLAADRGWAQLLRAKASMKLERLQDAERDLLQAIKDYQQVEHGRPKLVKNHVDCLCLLARVRAHRDRAQAVEHVLEAFRLCSAAGSILDQDRLKVESELKSLGEIPAGETNTESEVRLHRQSTDFEGIRTPVGS